MQERGDAGVDLRSGFEPITALQDVGLAQLLSGDESQRRGTLRPFFPQSFNTIIGIFKSLNRRAPIAEHRRYLRWASLFAGKVQNLPYLGGNRVCNDRCRAGRRGEAKPAQVIVHQVIAVPTAMVLREVKDKDGAACKSDVRGALKNGFARLVSAAWPGV